MRLAPGRRFDATARTLRLTATNLDTPPDGDARPTRRRLLTWSLSPSRWATGGSTVPGAAGPAGCLASTARDNPVAVRLNDDGSLVFLDRNGLRVPPELERLTRNRHEAVIRHWLNRYCNALRDTLTALESIHLDTPPPDHTPIYTPGEFTVGRPMPPQPQPLSMMARFVGRVRSRIEGENELAWEMYEKDLFRWEADRKAFERAQAARKELLEIKLYSNPEAMGTILQERLGEMDWPWNTEVAYAIAEQNSMAYLELELPRRSELPARLATLAANGWRLNFEALGETKLSRVYAAYIHGAGFRLIGETFAALPTVRRVTLSGWAPRPDASGRVPKRDYLYSVEVDRETWGFLSFDVLASVDPVQALARFRLRRQLGARGAPEPIEPFPFPWP